ncbi:MAG: hypothetical protein EBZ69_00745 [Alphaproteobacteria bacterium]|nr:hypothetical protein [Alphaproteobacteria bacterium]
MQEANVANTVTILGKTNATPVWTHWKTIAQNDPANRAAVKINSLFITNRSVDNVTLDMRLARDVMYVPGSVYYGRNAYFHLMNKWPLPPQTTVVAISRDNPVWLQPGDFLQILGSLNYCCEAVCSYEFVSDQSPEPVVSVVPSPPVMNLNAAPIFKSGSGNNGGTLNGGVELTWSPPFWTGGAEITNYLVQARFKVVVSASPRIEGFTGWFSLDRPVSSIPNLTMNPSFLLMAPRSTDDITSAYAPISINLTSFNSGVSVDGIALSSANIVGFQFRVAPYTPAGLGQWSAPSEMLLMDSIGTIGDYGTGTATRVGVVEAISAEALPNGATLSWEGKEARLNPRSGESLVIKDYRVRWSDDNGATWLPSAAGIRLNNPNDPSSGAEVRGLLNGVNYVFSVQTICTRTHIASGITDELVGPWSLPTRNVVPPGYTTPTQAQNAVKVMFVRWEETENEPA